MIKTYLSTTTIFLLSAAGLSAQQTKNGSGPRFLDDISVEVAPTRASAEPAQKASVQQAVYTNKKENTASHTVLNSIESAEKLQFKYSILLDTEVETVQSTNLIRLIDEWFGTRYRLGGSTKAGIDCSALMQVFFTSFYGLSIPRTAREQYAQSIKIKKEELQEGDLIFFNTTGGVSHVGMYLQNNKFVHASTSGGVTISDLDEDYWSKRFLSAGRIDTASLASSSKP